MEETPISDKNNLSVDSYGTEFLENFLYEIGLLLDSEIPVNGFTNSQRIEIAVNRYIYQSARIRELEEVAEGMLFEVKRTISPELREKAEQALNKTEQS